MRNLVNRLQTKHTSRRSIFVVDDSEGPRHFSSGSGDICFFGAKGPWVGDTAYGEWFSHIATNLANMFRNLSQKWSALSSNAIISYSEWDNIIDIESSEFLFVIPNGMRFTKLEERQALCFPLIKRFGWSLVPYSYQNSFSYGTVSSNALMLFLIQPSGPRSPTILECLLQSQRFVEEWDSLLRKSQYYSSQQNVFVSASCFKHLWIQDY